MNKVIYTPNAMGASARVGGRNYNAPSKETLLAWAYELFPHLEFELVKNPKSL